MHIRIKNFRKIEPVQEKRVGVRPSLSVQMVSTKTIEKEIKYTKQISRYREIDRSNIGVVVAAIDDYGPKKEQWRLYKCVTDAVKFRKMLKTVYDIPARNFKILYNKEATKFNILKALQDLSKNYDYGVFFWSGHGFRVQDLTEKDRYEEGIVTYSHAWSRANMLLGDDIHERLQSMKRCYVFADSCHSGGISRNIEEGYRRKEIIAPIEGVKLGKKKKINAKDIIEFAACESHQSAYELLDGGAFTTNLIKLLEKYPDMPFHQLQYNLRENIYTQQTPIITAPDAEQYLFVE